MKSLIKYLILLPFLLLSIHTCSEGQSKGEGIRIAFLADVHFQDVYGDFQDTGYKGIWNPENEKYATIRTMDAQLHSTRIFNENYFAFLAALDDIANRGIPCVVLPGDFSDDGQPVHMRRLKQILDEYSSKHGITFLATTGNHDPVRPFSREAGKPGYLGKGGKKQDLKSSKDLQQLGYREIVTMLGDFGFFPGEEFLYWETPFSSYSPQTYSYSLAAEESSLENRSYPLPPNGNMIPDVSYLVEPVAGLWLLALDANVYLPGEKAGSYPADPNSYSGSGEGYKNLLSHKKHLVKWVEKVAGQAVRLDKTLIVFSHYPLVDFNDDASGLIRDLLGWKAMNGNRLPGEDVAQIFADAGVRIHLGGHIHINDTGIRTSARGNTLVNVQIPSLAAYPPAYKLLTINGKQYAEVETVILDSVPRYDELFESYRLEHARLEETGSPQIWNKDILEAGSYHEFTSRHLEELVRLRYLPGEWPPGLRDFLLKRSGLELLLWSHGGQEDKARRSASVMGLRPEDFEEWTGFDLVYDFYRLRNADRLAIKDVGTDRIRQYQLIFEALLSGTEKGSHMDEDILEGMVVFAKIFHMILNGAPADHFQVDLKSGMVEDLSR